jgi:hypothetical protein
LDESILEALSQDTLVDITTTGRATGDARRLEIWFHYLQGHLYISGSPGTRGWYANLLARPDFTFHFKQSLVRDVPALATPITDPARRRDVIALMRATEKRMERSDVEAWVAGSPLVEVELLPGA